MKGKALMDGSRPRGSMSRAGSVDGLRGLALAGIALVHLQEFYDCDGGVRAVASLAHGMIYMALAGKMFSLLAICFGFSCHMVAGGRTDGPLVANPAACIWRLVVLAVIGWAHSLLYRDDILTTLALVGLILLPLQAIRANGVLMLLACLCFLQPAMLLDMGRAIPMAHVAAQGLRPPPDLTGHIYATGSLADVVRANAGFGETGKWAYLFASGRALQTIGYALVGIVLGRTGFFEDEAILPAPFSRPSLLIFAALCALIGSRLYFHSASLSLARHGAERKQLISGWVDLLLTFAYLAGFRHVWNSRLRSFLRMFCPLGRLSLSFYIGQSLVFVPLFYHFGMGLCDAIDANGAALLGLAAAIVQVPLAIGWRRHFLVGPMEWLWRAGTRTRLDVPFRRQRPVAPIPGLGGQATGPS